VVLKGKEVMMIIKNKKKQKIKKIKKNKKKNKNKMNLVFISIWKQLKIILFYMHKLRK
jgi:hypothetical protein